MPETFTHENFTSSALPNGVSKTDRDTITRAVEIGWKLLVTNRGHMTLIAPTPHDHIKLNITQSRGGRGEGPVKQVRRKIEQLADPVLLAVADGKPEPDDTPGVHTVNPVMTPDIAAAVLAKVDKGDEIVDTKADVAPVPERRFEGADEPLDLDDEPEIRLGRAGNRHILRQEPMVAHAGDKRGYVSETTLQRWWSDGSTDFKCAQPDCEFTSDSRRGVGQHWRVHVRAGEVKPWDGKTVTLVTDHVATPRDGYTPRADRISALAADLKALLEEGIDWSDLDAAAHRLAEEALHWDHRQSVTRSALASEREPLTPEQTLDRIRALIDGGLYLEQQRRIDELLDRHETERLAREAAEARAKKAHDTLQAFRELAAEATD